ncbi:hypothetical protein L1987_21018 [Smallanthus sonchifolius]|uniref:Uncharacterized protein n=1 Tax=Smallanthus sonchifolius TaxID=185202 RepID=A0ACB9IT80_9ASTR|nr:hypothetical protein L1987_21018 [Smallanthus sonchifolius]
MFQPKNRINTRATYKLSKDGTVQVYNETWSCGKRAYIEGTAFKADPKSDEAKFKVRFYEPPFLPIFPIVGDYWVLYLDDDYQYALIGQLSRKYLWSNILDEEIYDQLVERAKIEEYDVTKLKKTTQTDPPPKSKNGPVDTKGIWWIKSIFGK